MYILIRDFLSARNASSFATSIVFSKLFNCEFAMDGLEVALLLLLLALINGTLLLKDEETCLFMPGRLLVLLLCLYFEVVLLEDLDSRLFIKK